MNENNPDYIPPYNPDGTPPTSPPPTPTPPQPSPVPPVPPPPSAEDNVDIRTMSGDVQDPQVFKPSTGSEPVFSPQIPPTPQLPPQMPKGSPHNKALVISIISVASIVILGGLLYLFVFSGGEEPIPPAPQPPVEPTPPPVEPIPPTEPPTEPPGEPVPPTEPPAEPPVEPTPPPPPPFEHQSLFPAASNVAVIEASIEQVGSNEIKASIETSFASETKVPVFKEVAFSSGGNDVDSLQLLRAIMPSLTVEFIRANLEQDFTAFAYKDKDGVWPGYVFSLISQDPPSESKPEIFSLVEQASSNFYIENPGAASGEFRAGAKPSENFKEVRYLPYTVAGASFNIGWVDIQGDQYMLFSTSFNGFKEAARLLGF